MGEKDPNPKCSDYLKEVKRMVDGVRFGSVTIIIQDGKVIQIDKTEKTRFL